MSAPIRLTSETQAGRVLGELRQRSGLRQSDLAQLLHVSTATVSDREQVRRGLAAGALIATAQRLGYEVMLVERANQDRQVAPRASQRVRNGRSGRFAPSGEHMADLSPQRSTDTESGEPA